MQCSSCEAQTQPFDISEIGTARRILIADSEVDHCARVLDALDAVDASIYLARSMEEFIEQLHTAPPDVVLLDPMFAEGQALALYREHSQDPRPGLVVFTQDHSVEMRIAGAEAGADHLVYKPIIQEELPLLIDDLLCRINGARQVDQWVLDSLRWLLHTPQGVQVSLTYREMLIVNSLASSPGRAIPRDVLIQTLGFNPADYDVRRLEILVRRLRGKVAGDADLSLPITTVHGTGYAFTAPIRIID